MNKNKIMESVTEITTSAVTQFWFDGHKISIIIRLLLIVILFYKFPVCPRGVMVKAMDYGIVVSEFVLLSRYYVHFGANTLGKV